MTSILFSLDEIPRELVTETTALYRLDGSLRILSGTSMFLEEDGVPLIELALWLSHWLHTKEQIHAFCPSGYAENEGDMLRLVSTGGTQYCLSYFNGETSGGMTAEQTEWEDAFKRFLIGMRQELQRLYNIQLDNILLRFTPFSA